MDTLKQAAIVSRLILLAEDASGLPARLIHHPPDARHTRPYAFARHAIWLHLLDCYRWPALRVASAFNVHHTAVLYARRRANRTHPTFLAVSRALTSEAATP